MKKVVDGEGKACHHRTPRCRRKWMWRKSGSGHHGTITLFLCVLLSVIIPVGCILTDMLRLRMAQVRTEGALRLAAESLLTAYDRPMREQYGLLAMSALEEEESTMLASEWLRDSLEAAPDEADPFGLEVLDVRVFSEGGLHDPDVLSPMLSSYMRYRAPVRMTAGFVDKLRAFGGGVRQTGYIGAEMELERLRAGVREALVRLTLLNANRLVWLGGKGDSTHSGGLDGSGDSSNLVGSYDSGEASDLVGLNDWNDSDDSGGLRKTVEEDLNRLEAQTRGAIRLLEEEIILLAGLLEKGHAMEAALASAREDAETAARAERLAATKASAAETDWKNAESEGLEGVEALYLTYLAARDTWIEKKKVETEATRVAGQMGAQLEIWRSSVWAPHAEAVLNAMTHASNGMSGILEVRRGLETHFRRHAACLTKAVALTEEMVGQLDQIDQKTQAAVALVAQAGGDMTASLSATIGNSPAFPDASTMTEVWSHLRTRLGVVAGWLEDAEMQRIEAESLRDALALVMRGYADDLDMETLPDDIPVLPAEAEAQPLPGTGMDGLSGFGDTVDMMASGLLRMPVFTIGQPPSEQEQVAFEEWVSSWSEAPCGEMEANASPVSEASPSGGVLRSLREAAANTVTKVREGVRIDDTGTVLTEAETVSLPSHLHREQETTSLTDAMGHPFGDSDGISSSMHENRPNALTESIQRVADTSTQLQQVLAKAPDALVRTLWSNTYILAAFTNATTPESGIPHEITWGRDLSDNAFEKGEVEYILFGNKSETVNMTLAGGALFAVRLAMNLIHVFASGPKRTATLALASTLAGWTAIGIPVVQNFLMLAWAAAESFVDVDRLRKGEAVPLVKTEANWFLSVGSLRGELVRNLLLDPLKGRVAGAAGALVGKADDAVRETVGGWTDAAVEALFAPLETRCQEVGASGGDPLPQETEGVPASVSHAIGTWVGNLSGDSVQDMMQGGFEASLAEWVASVRDICAQSAEGMGVQEVIQLRERVKEALKTGVFESTFYSDLVTHAESTLMGLSEDAFAAVEQEAERLTTPGATTEGTGTGGLENEIAGRMATMTYEEYMAVFLLMLPEETKTLRVADLMQLNLQRRLGGEAPVSSNLATRIVVEADVRMAFWFLPETWWRKWHPGEFTRCVSMGYGS